MRINMKKRVFIIHGWGFKPKHNWYPWLKKELESKEFEAYVPEMPNTDEPEIGAWVGHLEEIVGKPDEQTYFVGHSVGCQTILRYLEKSNAKIGGIVCVAGWFNLAGLKEEGEEVIAIARPWIETPIDFEKVKNTASNITAIFSDNEPYGYVEENKKVFEDKLNAKIIIEHKKGHFEKDDGVTEIPSVLEAIIKISE